MKSIKQKWWKQGIEGGASGCLCCGGTVYKLPMNTRMYQGMGGWMIVKNGELFFMDKGDKEFEDYPTLMKFENEARKEPNAEWIAQVDLPLSNAKYQRHDKNTWVLIEKGEGFA